MKRTIAMALICALILSLASCGTISSTSETSEPNDSDTQASETVSTETPEETIVIPENFVLIEGGTFEMGSPDTEAWRSTDETQHTVTVSDFYISAYEVTQQEYQAVMGSNPSNFSGEDLPVESISWLDAVAYCNALSEQEGPKRQWIPSAYRGRVGVCLPGRHDNSVQYGNLHQCGRIQLLG